MDLENVHATGFRGYEYLEPEDTLVLFYSKAYCKVPGIFLTVIENSGCNVQGIKLQEIGKNALDFYLVSHVGRLIEGDKGVNEIAIISKDKGYQALKDYYDKYLERDLHIIFAPDIQQSIFEMHGEEGARRRKGMNMTKACGDLDTFIEQCSKRKIKKEKFQICSEEPVEMVTLDKRERLSSLIADSSLTASQLYHKILHIYGIPEGTKVYRRVKTARALAAQYNNAKEDMAV